MAQQDMANMLVRQAKAVLEFNWLGEYTMPWTAILFGLVIFSGAVVSVLLMMIQSLFANASCSLCLVSAVISLAICGREADEVLADLEYLQRVRASSGESVWRVLWGWKRGEASVWAHLLSAALRSWLMAAPDVLGCGGTAGLNDHVVGPIVVGSAVVVWPVMRPLRWVWLVVGVWLLVAS